MLREGTGLEAEGTALEGVARGAHTEAEARCPCSVTGLPITCDHKLYDLVTSAKTLFPNKVTWTGTGG